MGDGSCQGIHVEHGMEDGLAPLLESARGGGQPAAVWCIRPPAGFLTQFSIIRLCFPPRALTKRTVMP